MSGGDDHLIVVENTGWVAVRGEPVSIRVRPIPDRVAVYVAGDGHATLSAESVGAMIGMLASAIGWVTKPTPDGFRIVIPRGTE